MGTAPTLLTKAACVAAAGTKPKLIDERVSSARTVLKGLLRVEYRGGVLDVPAGQAVIAHRGSWVRHSTPEPEGAEYIAVCIPAFTLDAAHRDSERT